MNTLHGDRYEAEQMQWEFDDPAVLTGSDADKLVQVRRIRNAIRLKIDHWVSAISEATA